VADPADAAHHRWRRTDRRAGARRHALSWPRGGFTAGHSACHAGVVAVQRHTEFRFGLRVTTDGKATGRTSDDASLAASRLLEAGRVRGGRWFSGRPIQSPEAARTPIHYDEVSRQVFRKKELGGEQCLKNYFDKYRAVTQWIAAASARGGDLARGPRCRIRRNALSVADGYSWIIGECGPRRYRDVVEYAARAGHDLDSARQSRTQYEIRVCPGAAPRICWLMTQTARKARKFERYSPGR